jgi:superfamily II DNA or RNA helicase
MESANVVQGVSFRKVPRIGQREAINSVVGRDYLNVKLPTGYGKTFVACGCYSVLKAQGRVNRLLMIFPTDAQLEQFKQGGPDDLLDAGVDGPRQVIDLRFFLTQAIKKHRMNTAQVFVVTIQSLIKRQSMEIVGQLFTAGNWMTVVDEYHHYGSNGAWGKTVMGLASAFTLAMSATPRRKDDDSVFGAPHVSIDYRAAVDEFCVKPLIAHSYVYRLDLLDGDDVMSLTTDELIDLAGGDSPKKIDALIVTRKMRWSPKYVSPLVSIPLERMLSQRASSGHRLQAIIGAMSVSHAEMVCAQVKSMFGDVLSVDWVGTGDDGRPPDKNRKIIEQFCPPKDEASGRRNPTLDVLVHVGMAGEGLDSVNVSEVIHLNSASWNNSNDQENGRASRYLPDVVGHINFDSTSEYVLKGYVGEAIMDAMDANRPQNTSQDEQVDRPECDHQELPERPMIVIHNLELDRIDSGSPEVVRMKHVLVKHLPFTEEDIRDPESPIHELAATEYQNMRRRECQQMNEESSVRQWQESVNVALSVVTGLARRRLYPDGGRFDKTVMGDIKRRINTRKKAELGPVAPDIETCERHYAWIKSLERALINGEVPAWLA